MLDFVISKIAMIVAAIFLLLAAIGIYGIQKNATEEEELQNIADKIAKSVNELSSLNANTRVNLTFDRYGEGIYIKSTVGDDVYTIWITQSILFLTQDGRRVSSDFVGTIHVWKPDNIQYSRAEMENLDDANGDMKINSGNDIVIVVERKLIEVSGESQYHTFVYLL